MSEIKDLPKWKPGLGSCPDIPDYQREIDEQDATIAALSEELKKYKAFWEWSRETEKMIFIGEYEYGRER